MRNALITIPTEITLNQKTSIRGKGDQHPLKF